MVTPLRSFFDTIQYDDYEDWSKLDETAVDPDDDENDLLSSPITEPSTKLSLKKGPPPGPPPRPGLEWKSQTSRWIRPKKKGKKIEPAETVDGKFSNKLQQILETTFELMPDHQEVLDQYINTNRKNSLEKLGEKWDDDEEAQQELREILLNEFGPQIQIFRGRRHKDTKAGHYVNVTTDLMTAERFGGKDIDSNKILIEDVVGFASIDEHELIIKRSLLEKKENISLNELPSFVEGRGPGKAKFMKFFMKRIVNDYDDLHPEIQEILAITLSLLEPFHLLGLKSMSFQSAKFGPNIKGVAETAATYNFDENHINIYKSGQTIETIIHEIGHNLQHTLEITNPELMDDWRTVFQKSKKYQVGFPSEYSKMNINEFIAECFATYRFSSRKMEERNPYAYEILKKIHKNFAGYDVSEDLDQALKEINKARSIEGVIFDPPGVGEFDEDLPNLEEDDDENDLLSSLITEPSTKLSLKKGLPPGPPPRPGLQWKPQTSRWIRPKDGEIEKPISPKDRKEPKLKGRMDKWSREYATKDLNKKFDKLVSQHLHEKISKKAFIESIVNDSDVLIETLQMEGLNRDKEDLQNMIQSFIQRRLDNEDFEPIEEEEENFPGNEVPEPEISDSKTSEESRSRVGYSEEDSELPEPKKLEFDLGHVTRVKNSTTLTSLTFDDDVKYSGGQANYGPGFYLSNDPDKWGEVLHGSANYAVLNFDGEASLLDIEENHYEIQNLKERIKKWALETNLIEKKEGKLWAGKDFLKFLTHSYQVADLEPVESYEIESEVFNNVNDPLEEYESFAFLRNRFLDNMGYDGIVIGDEDEVVIWDADTLNNAEREDRTHEYHDFEGVEDDEEEDDWEFDNELEKSMCAVGEHEHAGILGCHPVEQHHRNKLHADMDPARFKREFTVPDLSEELPPQRGNESDEDYYERASKAVREFHGYKDLNDYYSQFEGTTTIKIADIAAAHNVSPNALMARLKRENRKKEDEEFNWIRSLYDHMENTKEDIISLDEEDIPEEEKVRQHGGERKLGPGKRKGPFVPMWAVDLIHDEAKKTKKLSVSRSKGVRTIAASIEKQAPPGPPPREGLKWKPQTHRWIRPEESKGSAFSEVIEGEEELPRAKTKIASEVEDWLIKDIEGFNENTGQQLSLEDIKNFYSLPENLLYTLAINQSALHELESSRLSIEIFIYDKLTGNSVGSMDRTFRIEEEELIVSHDSFFIDKDHQGNGIASSLNEWLDQEYKKAGVKSIRLLANGDVGKYAWAVQGFDFWKSDPDRVGDNLREMRSRFEWRFTEDIRRELQGRSDKSGSWTEKWNKNSDGDIVGLSDYSSSTVLWYEDRLKEVAAFEHPWEFALWNPFEEEEGKHFGKMKMLSGTAIDYNATKRLVDGEPSYEIGQLYWKAKREKRSKADITKAKFLDENNFDLGELEDLDFERRVLQSIREYMAKVDFSIEKQAAPGPPPREGLKWKPQTHRWIRPEEANIEKPGLHWKAQTHRWVSTDKGVDNPEISNTPETGNSISMTLYRGKGKEGDHGFSSDPGDFGIGEYFTTHESTAKTYGDVTSQKMKFNNPLVLEAEDIGKLSDKYNTIQGSLNERLQGSKQLTEDLSGEGYDAVIAHHYDAPKGHYTVLPLRKPGQMTREEFKSTRVSQQQMLARGADGHLRSANEIQMPISRIEGLEPVPSPAEGGNYAPGKEIAQPVEIRYERDLDQFTLYGGNHRVQQAKVNGDTTIPAFVEGLKYEDLKDIFSQSQQAKEPWEMTQAEFIANPPEGFRFEPGREGILANRHKSRGETIVYEGFFNLDINEKKDLLAHEEGHDLINDVVPQGIQEGGLMDPFKIGDEPLSIHTLYEADWSFRGVTPEEIIADAYSELVSEIESMSEDDWAEFHRLWPFYAKEKAQREKRIPKGKGRYRKNLFDDKGDRVPKYDELFHAVAKAALKQGKFVPEEVLSLYPDLSREEPSSDRQKVDFSIKKQAPPGPPPGPPPRPGLHWKAQTHRWIRPGDEEVEDFHSAYGEEYDDDEIQETSKKIRKSIQRILRKNLHIDTVRRINKVADKYAEGMADEHYDDDFEDFVAHYAPGEDAKTISDIHKEIAQSFFGDEPRTMYRGLMDVHKYLEGTYREGDSMEIPAHNLSSWTPDINVAKGFSNRGLIVSKEFEPSDVVLAPVLYTGTWIREFAYQKEFIVENSERSFAVNVEKVDKSIKLKKSSMEEGLLISGPMRLNLRNIRKFEDEYPDPGSSEVYDWIENQIQKAGLNIEGIQARGAKAVGIGIESLLYGSLQNSIDDFLNTLSGSEQEAQVLDGMMKAVRNWQAVNATSVAKAFEQLFTAGFRAGGVSTGRIGTFDEQALNVIKEGQYSIGNRIELFGDESIKKFGDVIHDAYTEDGIFSLPSMVEKMGEHVETSRGSLERIARTETSNVSHLGRIAGWAQDDDKYYWNYNWNHTPDGRVREMKKMRAEGNPYSFSEILYLWTHNKQQLPNGKWEMGVINCRCSLSRSPREDELKGNRFAGKEHLFEKTVDFDVSLLTS